jgi:ketosteroid isomerase-like protein
VVNAVRAAFDALRDDDQNAWSLTTTADFLAFDGGARLDGAQLFRAVKTAHAAGKIYEWNITEPDPHVSCGLAWVDYVNRGSIRGRDGKSTSVEWLESAVLRYDDGRWRLVFLHSTRVTPKA